MQDEHSCMQKIHQKLYFNCYSVYYKHTYAPEYRKNHADHHSKMKKVNRYEEYSIIKLRFIYIYVYILLIRIIYKDMKSIAKNERIRKYKD